jgi:hypothetical protein
MLRAEAAVGQPGGRLSVQALQAWWARLGVRWEHVQASAAGEYWTRLTAADFMTSSFAFAALGVLCAFPFLAVVAAASGGDFRQAIIARMGLNKEAAADVNSLISSGTHAVATLDVLGAAFLLVGALGMASTLQAWYAKIYDQPHEPSVIRRLSYQAAGLVAFSAYISVNIEILNALKPIGGRGLMLVTQFVLSTLYWWVAAYFILFRKIPLRKLFPAGLATGACVAGLGVFSTFLFSGEITSGEKTYGPAGVVIALISYMVGFGVCLHLGAVFGRMWNDWHAAGAAIAHKEAALTSHAGSGEEQAALVGSS